MYTGEVWRNTTGGLHIGERYLDNLDLLATWNGSDRPGGGRSRAQLYVLYNNGAGLTDELIGDLQTVSNIDAPEAWRLYEAWYEYGFANASSLRFGLYDLNSEFDSTETGGLFINSSHGVGPDLSQSGVNGPSIFPVTSLAIRFELPIGQTVRTRFAVLDAVPGDPDSSGSNSIRVSPDEGAVIIGEADFAASEAARIYGGAWFYTEEASTVLAGLTEADGERDRSSGLYLGAELSLAERVRAFARLGRASDRVHPIEYYVGGGVSWGTCFLANPR